MRIDWSKDYYAILQVPRFSSFDELKKSYRELAKKYHPDLNPGNKLAEERFKEINQAYDVLSDAQNKTIYDERLRNPASYRTRDFQQQQYDQFRRRQYEQYKQEQGEQFRRAQERQRKAREESESPNYDISPMRVIYFVLFVLFILRNCSHRAFLP